MNVKLNEQVLQNILSRFNQQEKPKKIGEQFIADDGSVIDLQYIKDKIEFINSHVPIKIDAEETARKIYNKLCSFS